MTWHTNSAIIQLHDIARKAGMARPLSRLMPNRCCEAAFENAAQDRPGWIEEIYGGSLTFNQGQASR